MNQTIVKTDLKRFNFSRLLRIISIIIPLAIAGNIIYVIIAGEPEILRVLSDFKLNYLILAIIMVLIPLATHSLRMLLWARTFKNELQPVQAFKTAVAAEIGNGAMPTMVGGSYAKLLFLIGYGFSPGQATMVTVLGTIEDIAFFAFALPIVIYFSKAWDNPFVIKAVDNLLAHWPIVMGAIIALIIATLLLKRLRLGQIQKTPDNRRPVNNIRGRLRQRVKNFREDLSFAMNYALKQGKSTLVICTLIGGIGWSSRYAAINALLLGLGFKVDPLLYALLHWVVFSTMTLIPTPGAVGGAEVSFALVFSGIIPAGAIPLMTGVWRFLTFYMTIAAGAIYLAIAGPDFSRNSLKATEPESISEMAVKQLP